MRCPSRYRLVTCMSLLGFSPLALAHVRIGTYPSSENCRAACSIEVTAIGFDGIEHPLNECVNVTTSGLNSRSSTMNGETQLAP